MTPWSEKLGREPHMFQVRKDDRFMVKTNEIAYSIYSSSTGEHYCNISLKFRNAYIEDQNVCHMGRVFLTYFYKPANKNELHSNSIKVDSFFKGEWIKSSTGPHHDFTVNNFIPPTCLRGQGINTFVWSQIYRGLPTELQGSVILRGKLSAGDAKIPLLDKYRRVVQMWEKNHIKTLMINNIEKRNQFWMNCINATDKYFELSCDKDTGEGSFRGTFIDPYPDKNDDYVRLNKIVITKIDPQQVTQQPVYDEGTALSRCIM